jgi:hypothetical protein
MAWAQREVESAKQQDVESHLAVVLRQGHGGVDRGLPGCYWHGGSVTDDDGPFHQGSARPGVGQFRELPKGFYNLTGPLSTGRHDHDIHIGVPGSDLLEDCFTRTKGSRDTISTAPGHRE